MSDNGGLAYIRKTYGVPAKRGMRIRIECATPPYEGRITSARSGYLILNGTLPFHPTWRVVYLNEDGSILHDTREDRP